MPIEEAVKVNVVVPEFEKAYSKEFFEDRYKDKEKLIIVAYVNNESAGYMVSYDKFNDSSFYCWMAGVNPVFRKKGVFKSLINYCIQWAKEKGYDKIRLKTRNHRREMLSYLIKYDFHVIEVDSRDKIEDNRVLFEKNI